MFIEERHAQIIDLLQKDGKVTVKEWAEIFNVGEGMIRKDLQKLENSIYCSEPMGERCYRVITRKLLLYQGE